MGKSLSARRNTFRSCDWSNSAILDLVCLQCWFACGKTHNGIQYCVFGCCCRPMINCLIRLRMYNIGRKSSRRLCLRPSLVVFQMRIWQSNWQTINSPSLETANVMLKSFGSCRSIKLFWKMLLQRVLVSFVVFPLSQSPLYTELAY